jgi:hypothetical protein
MGALAPFSYLVLLYNKSSGLSARSRNGGDLRLILTKSELSCGKTGVARNGLVVSVTTLVETTMSVDIDASLPCSDVIWDQFCKTFFSSSLTMELNKLERFSLSSYIRLVWHRKVLYSGKIWAQCYKTFLSVIYRFS